MTKYYAAYGSNLNKAQMKARCPKATAMGAVELPKAQLVFNGVADVVFHETKTAMIGLWKITDACERELDMYEGVISRKDGHAFKSGAYRKETIRVIVTEDGAEVETDALIYVMNRDKREMPMLSYLNRIKDGFKDFGLDEKWLREALVDTRADIAKQATERAARWAKEDAERAKQKALPYYQQQRSPHHGITDLFDGPSYSEAQARYYDEKRGAGDDIVWDDEPLNARHIERLRLDAEAEFEAFNEETYTSIDPDTFEVKMPPRRLRTEQDYRNARETLERHNKSGYKLPVKKSVHLFDEPYRPKQKAKS